MTPSTTPMAPNLPQDTNPMNPSDQVKGGEIESFDSGVVMQPIPPVLPNSEEFTVALAKSGKELGQSGTLIFQGLITMEDYNTKLTGRSGYDIFDEMRRSDGTVRAALQVCKQPIIAADWEIEPASQNDEDIFIADFIRDQLFTSLNWKQTLRELLLELDFGFSVAELIYKTVKKDGRTLIGLERLASRKQYSIFSWVTQYNTQGITQIVPSGGTLSIPREKLLIVTHEKEGDNYAGISLLRAAYKHWYFKKGIEKVDAIAIERQGAGILKVTVPPGASDPDKAKAREIARNVRTNEQQYLEAPTGFELDFADMKAHTLRDPVASMIYHDRQIMKSVLAQFMELGGAQSGGSGSRAVSQDHSELFMQALESESSNIAEAIYEDVIKRLVAINFGEAALVPKLICGVLEAPDPVKLSGAYKTFTDSGALTPTLADEQHIRTVMNLPLLDEDEVAVAKFKEKLEEMLVPLPVVKPPFGGASTADETTDAPAEPVESPNAPIARALLLEILMREAKNDKITKDEIKQMEVKLLSQQIKASEPAQRPSNPLKNIAQRAREVLNDALRFGSRGR